MTKRPQQKKGTPSHLGRLAAICLWLGAWEAASLLVHSSLLLAGPVETGARLVQLAVTPAFWGSVLFSFLRIAGGFILGFAGALALAGAAHARPLVATLVSPAMTALKSTPLVCVIVLLLMWVGPSYVSIIAVFLVAFPATYFAALEALDSLDPKVAEMLQVFRVPRLRRFCCHVWPEMLPFLWATAENVCGMSWKAGVAAELIGAPLGSIGERIYQAKILLETADLFSWTIAVIFFSWASGKLFLRLLEASRGWALAHAVPRARAATEVRQDAPSAAACGSAAIDLDAVKLGYDGAAVIGPITLHFAPGSRSVLTDASGAGKTTLLRTLAGSLGPVSGTCTATTTEGRPARVAMVFQEARLVDGLSIRDNVLLVAEGTLAATQADALLAELLPGVDPAGSAAALSGGQRRRVELARALAAPSDLVLLDEPFASLDEKAHDAACAFVRARLAGRTLVVATHDGQDARRLDARRISLRS